MLRKASSNGTFYDINAKVFFIDSDLYVKCEICSSFIDRSLFHSHILRHFFINSDSVNNFIKYKLPQSCTMCHQFNSISVNDILNHEVICEKSESTLFCIFCNKTFPLTNVNLNIKYIRCKSNKEYHNHILQHFEQENEFCNSCGLLFLTRQELVAHEKDHDESTTIFDNTFSELYSIDGNVSCDLDEDDPSLQSITQLGTCLECGSQLGSFFLQHYKNAYSCKLCRYQTNCDTSAWLHMNCHDKRSRRRSKCNDHIFIANPTLTGVNLCDKALNDGLVFECTCGLKSNQSNDIIQHMLNCEEDSRIFQPQESL